MRFRKLLWWQSAAVALMGGFAMTQPTAAQAQSTTDEGCIRCVPLGSCSDAWLYCEAWGCNDTRIGCGEFGSCNGDSRIVACNN